MDKLVRIPLKDIKTNGNVRDVDPYGEDIQALAKDMRENGQEVPIDVYPMNGSYIVRFGHRRLFR